MSQIDAPGYTQQSDREDIRRHIVEHLTVDKIEQELNEEITQKFLFCLFCAAVTRKSQLKNSIVHTESVSADAVVQELYKAFPSLIFLNIRGFGRYVSARLRQLAADGWLVAEQFIDSVDKSAPSGYKKYWVFRLGTSEHLPQLSGRLTLLTEDAWHEFCAVLPTAEQLPVSPAPYKFKLRTLDAFCDAEERAKTLGFSNLLDVESIRAGYKTLLASPRIKKRNRRKGRVFTRRADNKAAKAKNPAAASDDYEFETPLMAEIARNLSPAKREALAQHYLEIAKTGDAGIRRRPSMTPAQVNKLLQEGVSFVNRALLEFFAHIEEQQEKQALPQLRGMAGYRILGGILSEMDDFVRGVKHMLCANCCRDNKGVVNLHDIRDFLIVADGDMRVELAAENPPATRIIPSAFPPPDEAHKNHKMPTGAKLRYSFDKILRDYHGVEVPKELQMRKPDQEEKV